ncbi:MAG TPA: response regulator [Burkholderiales bacterium]|nr:response regulator [Burkholderiales bacterium]
MAKIGKYVVMGEVGRGTNCIVYSTLDPDVGRQVAVKTIAKALAPSTEDLRASIERLQREAHIGGKLHHSNIAAVYEYGEDEYAAWVAMEMVEAKSLRQHVTEGYRPAAEPLPALVAEILEALDYAHSAGVTHGDVRAENVLVSPSGAKLVSFRAVGDAATDVRAAAAMLKEVFAEAPAILDDPPPSARELLEGLRSKGKGKLGTLRRAMKAAPAPLLSPRRLPAVLFVDDEERVLHALHALFQGTYEVHTATSGAEALELIKAKRFLVIVSDQRMPGMTGVELLREARTLAPSAVRLLLTGFSDFGAIVASVNESEVFRYITKPWQQAELESTLGEAIEVAIAAEAAAAGGRHFDRASGNVVVLGQPALARSVRELSLGALGVQEAYDDETVLEIVSHEDIGVVVSELHARMDEPEALLHVLKKSSPHTQLVAISEVPDAELAIRLINEARIHRYLGKPVNLSILQQAVVSGLQRYSRLEDAPGLGGTERTKRRRKTHRLRRLFTRVKALRGRFRLFSGVGAR